VIQRETPGFAGNPRAMQRTKVCLTPIADDMTARRRTVLLHKAGGSKFMDFTAQMFIDLAEKSGFLIVYALAIAVAWWLGERVAGSFRRGQ
jgi:hypothetical protein